MEKEQIIKNKTTWKKATAKYVVLKIGGFLLDCSIALSFIIGIGMIFVDPFMGIGVILSVVVISYLVYLITDIRDKLSETNKILQSKDNL